MSTADWAVDNKQINQHANNKLKMGNLITGKKSYS